MPDSKSFFSCRIVFLFPALLTLAACSLLGGDNPRWDTDVPESAPVTALLGTWGPEGTRIAFVHTPDSAATEPRKFNQLWTYNLETDTMRRMMRGPLFTPHWSPSGNRLVFHSPIPQYLFTVDPDGQNLQKLTGPDSPNPDLENTVIGKWSPSGDRILYTIEAEEPRGVSMMKPDGSNARILIRYGVQAAWFPSGERIVYVNWDQSIEEGSRNKQIYVANADGTNQRKLTDLKNSRDVGWPSVSPDGEKIAFNYDDQIYLMSADGTNVRQVTGGDGFAAKPAWSPTGETILFFRRFTSRGYRSLFLLDVETLEVEPVFPAEGR
ncbi:TolB family protein [Salinibacter altiplanensis]|uniref:TolB family protein n=1 Tax=Salinibacter altiplanensis TaxID=1803181 RepID=UPI000C9F8A16|nr:PD40 domain-containing protein [Salinibacter altiplanensis]